VLHFKLTKYSALTRKLSRWHEQSCSTFCIMKIISRVQQLL